MGAHGVGMPAALKLDAFAELLEDAFNETPYQVGSSMLTTNWRDVDVRILLSDERWAAEGFGKPGEEHHNPRWRACVLAFSVLGRDMTGLPIDFQLQQQSDANKKFPGKEHPRSALIHRQLLVSEKLNGMR